MISTVLGIPDFQVLPNASGSAVAGREVSDVICRKVAHGYTYGMRPAFRPRIR
jgi:hypothetical protein